ncbi:MAG: hypothetical protein CL477_16180 [Acidobacteria bacterium]|jgi:hypothetical protein|nr:hypothetical protein [Acidobacteriota bacterium]MDP7338931.1 hypothetical protein [Vicinamibacterales bacterium]MDP7692776.1 hypothetical protein [Vicinamibacterales bacterium]HJN45450.1 hypothetical protein [Vicinamibacterales bacterium]|tara:strand:- start:290 stop:1021 length:732 start_codon:yes stop_codon:yes gene_type:complete
MHGRQRGWLIGAMVVASMVGGALSNLLLTARLDAQAADVVTASQVNIVDSAGRLRAVLAGEDERGLASLAFYGPDGTARGIVGAEADGTPVLQFNNPAGISRLSASVREEESVVTVGNEAARSVLIGSLGGTPLVGLSDGVRTRLQLTLGAQGEPRMSLINSAGQRGAGLVVGADDAPFLSLFDVGGVQRLTMGTVQGSTVVNLEDGTRPRLVLGVADNGRPSVVFYDADGALERDLSADTRR